MSNKPDVIDSTINDEKSLIDKWRSTLSCKGYNSDSLINYRLLDKILFYLHSKLDVRPFIKDKRGSKYFNCKMENKYHLVHLNIETAKVLINVLIFHFNWKRVEITYSQTTKLIEMDIYEYFDKDLLPDDIKTDKFVFTESNDTFRLRYISTK